MNYRVNWQAGMKLTDNTFRTADEYNSSRLYPLYSLLVKEGYGFIETPLVKFEILDSSISFIEINANAISYSGKLINLHYISEERQLFQNIQFPETNSPVIAYIDLSSTETIQIGKSKDDVPLCDLDYHIILKTQNDHYNNPDAVPFARFIYKYGWEMDTSFIAPCVRLSANGNLMRFASQYIAIINELIEEFKKNIASTQSAMIFSLIPILSNIVIEIEKEYISMSPLHFITLIQQTIRAIVISAELYGDLIIPEHNACNEYVASFYTPYNINIMVNEGIRLTKALIELPKSFKAYVPGDPKQEPVPHRPHGDDTRGRINRRQTGFTK